MLTIPQVSDRPLLCWSGRAVPMSVAHRHDEIELNFAEDGALVYLFGGTRVVIEPGCLAAFWAALPHQLVEASDQSTVHWATIPLAIFLSWQMPESLLAPLMAGEAVLSSDPSLRAADPANFRRWTADCTGGDSYLRETAALEIKSRLRRLAREPMCLAGSNPSEETTSTTHKAAAMARFVAAHYAESIQTHDVARAAFLHPRYAMSLFRRATGLTIVTYLTRCRVAAAQSLLVTTDATIAEVAQSAGFGSQSQFYEAFRAHCQQPPAAYRRQHAGSRHNAADNNP